MKKRTKGFLLTLAALLMLSVCPIVSYANDSESLPDTVYLSSMGNDNGTGEESDPYQTLDKALDAVADGGTICVIGTVNLPSSFTWSPHQKTVTIIGGELNFKSVSKALVLYDNVTFDHITLTFDSLDELYANGYRLTIGANAIVTDGVRVYGGGNKTTVKGDTHLTLLAGNYNAIYGGGNGGIVTGNTYLVVGGTVNDKLDVTNHSGGKYIYGGSLNGTVQGNTNLTFTGNAKATYLFGGASGTSGKIFGSSNVFLEGGKCMSIYGGSNKLDTGDANVVITGGEVEQVFGGCMGSSLTGNATVSLLGGKITRRVYGGCYNDMDNSGNCTTSYSVKGTVTVIIGGGTSITFSATEPGTTTKYKDRSLYARSRHTTAASTEKSVLIFADQAGYNTYKNKLGAQDFYMMFIMGSLSAADEKHLFQYAFNDTDKTITQICQLTSDYQATATMTLDPSVETVYTGKEIRAVRWTCDDKWRGPLPTIVYENNVNAGTATASCTEEYGGSISLKFQIEKASPQEPVLSVTHETTEGGADGRIVGLTLDMEYSTDGIDYTPITDTSMKLVPGVYWVRYRETENQNQSPATELTVNAFQAPIMTDEGTPEQPSNDKENNITVIVAVSIAASVAVLGTGVGVSAVLIKKKHA